MTATDAPIDDASQHPGSITPGVGPTSPRLRGDDYCFEAEAAVASPAPSYVLTPPYCVRFSRKAGARGAAAPMTLSAASRPKQQRVRSGGNRRAAAATEGAGLSCGASGQAVISDRVIR